MVFLWQVNNCPVGCLDTFLKAELLLPKKIEFSEFFGLVPSLESPRRSVASKSVIVSMARGVDSDPFLLSFGVSTRLQETSFNL